MLPITILDFIYLIPYLFLITSAVTVILWPGVYWGKEISSRSLLDSSLTILWGTLLLIIITVQAAPILVDLIPTIESIFFSPYFGGGFLDISDKNVLFSIITILISIFIISVISTNDNTVSLSSINVELYFLRLVIIFAALLMTMATDLILIFFLLEIYSFCASILIAQKGKFSPLSSEAGMKYFVLSTLFSLFFIYGSVLIYGSFGTTNITSIEGLLSLNSVVDTKASMGLLFILIAVLFKLAAAPYHFWAPSVYDAAPTSAMFFLALVPKPALLSILFKLFPIISVEPFLLNVVYISSILSILLGSLLGIYQNRIKAILVYSSINGTGFLVISLLGINTTLIYGCSSTIMVLFLIFYLLTTFGLFTLVCCIKTLPHHATLKSMHNLSNLFFVNKTLSIALAFLLFSTAGLPPFIGFFTKYFLLITVSEFAQFFALFVILFSASLSVYVYIRIIKHMAFTKDKEYTLFLIKVEAINSYLTILSVAGVGYFAGCANTLVMIISFMFV